MIQVTGPKKILEIGTSIVYSTTSMAQAVKEYRGLLIAEDTLLLIGDGIIIEVKNKSEPGTEHIVTDIIGKFLGTVPDTCIKLL